ncbi:MAG: hypothetical protein HOM11_17395 [Methylococcales bacterium]|jgi:hypothetical protein|nr:hypothetical protein [Methylococcales bacterium]MBT7445477.1 hypothetical protein [Methylococcales bacterium]
MKAIYWVILALCLSSCLAESVTPITKVGDEVLDTRLFGTWYWHQARESGYIHIGKANDQEYDIVMVAINQASMKPDVSRYTGHSSTLANNNTYLNIITSNDEQPMYLFVKYTVNKQSMAISLAKTSVVKNAILSGTLKGRAPDLSAKVFDTQDNIQKFVTDNDDPLFEETVIVHRHSAN